MDFLEQDSNLLLLFSYLDPQSLVTVAQVFYLPSLRDLHHSLGMQTLVQSGP